MSFSQEMTQRAEADMNRMTEALIEGIIGIGGHITFHTGHTLLLIKSAGHIQD